MGQSNMAFGLAARDATGVLSPFSFPLRAKGDDDITLKILYCGICHSDLSTIKNEWRNAIYPVVPGHEIVGVITEAGRNVQKFRVGDKAGVGYFISSCLSCDDCKQDSENYCPQLVPTFNSSHPDGTPTYGGFSNKLVVNEHFAVRIPTKLPVDKVAPLLCAGIAVYNPLKEHGLSEPGKHLGVVGLGGLGHLAVKFSKAFGVKVTVISTSPDKEKEATEKLGADSFIVSRDPEQMKAAMGTMDGILDTIAADHSLMPLFALLKTRGKLIALGGMTKPTEISLFPIMAGGKIMAGSIIGGVKGTQDMLSFAEEHNITAEVEVIGMDDVNTAMERLQKGDVRFRFVIDVANTIRLSYKIQNLGEQNNVV
ncbi:probable cinnamyl alcohol dehydrogenase 9 isoform X2 [Phoenix dactylifera]|uniref:cinnamyl-alcohol dehydrogenase n=1 Tax=Phoenix dactylifera TaxID=42345 RepID=A0A8B7MS96_PHODC|nr:probable cinnamyl alcohol dehydrogenase 9 isoform X2 [Phoenix dactylifera]